MHKAFVALCFMFIFELGTLPPCAVHFSPQNNFCIVVVYHSNKNHSSKSQMCLLPDAGMILPFESEGFPNFRLEPERTGEEIPVVITAAEERLGAVVAAMNSVYQNSKANVVFTVVTLNDTANHLK